MILPLSDATTFFPETINLCHWRRGKANKQQMKWWTNCPLLIQRRDLGDTLSIWLHKVRLMESEPSTLQLLLWFNTEISDLYLTLDTPECLTSFLNNLKTSAVGDNSTRNEEISGEDAYKSLTTGLAELHMAWAWVLCSKTKCKNRELFHTVHCDLGSTKASFTRGAIAWVNWARQYLET